MLDCPILSTIKLQSIDKVAHIELNVDSNVSMKFQFWQEFTECVAYIKSTQYFSTILISQGNSFKFSTVASLNQIVSSDKDEFRETLKRMQYSFTCLEESGIPVITCIDGACIGAGLELICSSDIRFATVNARFSLKEVDLGIVADLGGLQRMIKIVGSTSWVNDVCMSGRIFSGEEAHLVGLVTKLFDNHASMLNYAIEYAQLLSLKDRKVMSGIKQMLNHARDHTVMSGLDLVADYSSLHLTKDAAINLMKRFQDKDMKSKM